MKVNEILNESSNYVRFADGRDGIVVSAAGEYFGITDASKEKIDRGVEHAAGQSKALADMLVNEPDVVTIASEDMHGEYDGYAIPTTLEQFVSFLVNTYERGINETVSAEELAAMKAKSEEQGKQLGGLKAKLGQAKARASGKGGFDNRSRGRLRGRGRGTAAADQSMVQK